MKTLNAGAYAFPSNLIRGTDGKAALQKHISTISFLMIGLEIPTADFQEPGVVVR
jgi:hypothetical protein